jgi:hypothetical protein
MSAAAAVKEALWLRKLLSDFGKTTPTVNIYGDIQAALKLLKHPIASLRSKHIDVIYYFARERVARGEVKFEYISTDKMVAHCEEGFPFLTLCKATLSLVLPTV